MAHDLVTHPDHDRHRSLGLLAISWIEYFVRHGPGDVQGEPVTHTDEYFLFTVDAYAIATNGRRLYDSAFLSRPKGTDKSGMGARFCLFEALGPCRFAGWAQGGEVYEDPWGLGFRYEYEPGEAMGKHVRTPFVRVMATEETQTGNVYDVIYFNLTDDDCPLSQVPGLNAGITATYLPGGGEIRPSTASSSSKDGGKETFVCFDEALELDTPLPTPTGWTTMGEVEVGDMLLGATGEPVEVIKTSEVFTDRDCYRVTFSDGHSVVASQGHLWMTGVAGSSSKPRIRTTAEMVADGRRFKVPAARPWERPPQQLDIDPYVLGAWLGDGDSQNATITSAAADVDELAANLEQRGYTTTRCATGSDRAALLYVSVPGSRSNRFSPVDGLLVRLRRADLLGNKHIPSEYLLGSIEQRLALVQGLMDSDGSVTPAGNCNFVNSNERIIEGLLELLRSLGETPAKHWTSDDRSRSGGYWRITFTPRNVVPFVLARKASRVRRHQTARDLWVTIDSIEAVDQVPVKCVAVDSADHLFLAGPSGAVTHNTHLYNTPELRRMYATVTRNLRKRKKLAETWYIETTTMFAAGEDSVAEETYKLGEQIVAGNVKRPRLLFDHQYGICEDLADEKELTAAIAAAFGDSLAWNDLDGILNEFNDPRAHPADSCRYFLNAAGSAADAWLIDSEWAGVHYQGELPDRGDMIVVGFDGSRRRSHKVTDATALIGCRVSDGLLFTIKIWEQPPGPAGLTWSVPQLEVEAVVAATFAKYNVVGFFADPAKWESHVARWEAAYGSRLQVKSSRDHPIEWWMTGGRTNRIVQAIDEFYNAVVDKELRHDGSPQLWSHALNARRRPTRAGLQIAKEHPDSDRKIDGIVAAILAWQARQEAVAMGLHQTLDFVIPHRIR